MQAGKTKGNHLAVIVQSVNKILTPCLKSGFNSSVIFVFFWKITNRPKIITVEPSPGVYLIGQNIVGQNFSADKIFSTSSKLLALLSAEVKK